MTYYIKYSILNLFELFYKKRSKKIKKVKLNEITLCENFEELTEDCQFTIEAGCSGDCPDPHLNPEGYRDWWYQRMFENANRGYSGQWSWCHSNH